MKFRSAHTIEDSPTDYLVPMMDVLFILIIFFVVAFSMSRLETEVGISVPASESSSKASRDVGQVTINVRADGTLVVNQAVLSEQDLFRRLAIIAEENKKQAVVIRGDRSVAYEHIFRVLDNCRKVGLYHVSFQSQYPLPKANEP